MDTQLSRENLENLYWLGRYVERITALIDRFMETSDIMIDKNPSEYVDFCKKLGISNHYESEEHFISDFTLNEKAPYSIISIMNMAYQNAIVSRDILKIRCFGYLRNALSTLQKIDETRRYCLKDVKDSLFAFWGSLQEYIESQTVYSIILMGKYVEKIDLGIRFQRNDLYRSWARLEWMVNHFEISLQYEKITLESVNSLFERSFYASSVSI